jgi:hypothetical protein
MQYRAHPPDAENLAQSCDVQEAAELAQEIRQLMSRTPEDRREAVKMAVETAKTFSQIGIAVLVAIAGFIQFGFEHRQSSLSFWLFVAAAGFTFISMCNGFLAVSHAYKRGDGRQGFDDPIAWSTDALRTNLNNQALSGVVALVLIGLAVASYEIPSNSITILAPGGVSRTLAAGSEITLEGEWSQLTIEQKGQPILKLGAVPKGQKQLIVFSVK